MTQVHKSPQTAKNEQTTTEAPPARSDASTATTEAVKDDSDALLDEIDGILEENAEEFVSQYVQKGGQ